MTPVARAVSDGVRVAPCRLVPRHVDGAARVFVRRLVTGQSYARDGLVGKAQAVHPARGGDPLMSNGEQQILLLQPR